MQVDAQDYLRLVEKANTICFFDIEATGLRGDYNSVLVTSIKPFHGKPTSFRITQAGNDKAVVRQAKELLESYDIWVTYYGKGFDIPFIQARLLRHGLPALNKQPHADMYFALRKKLILSRGSMAHIASWLKLPEQKMSVSASVWSEVIASPKVHMPMLVERCESDCAVLEKLWKRTKHLIRDIKR